LEAPGWKQTGLSFCSFAPKVPDRRSETPYSGILQSLAKYGD